MPDASSPGSPEVSFAVDYNPYVGGAYNRDLGGKGRVVVRAAEPRFIFTGHPRGRFLISRQSTEIAMDSGSIRNVAVHDRGVEFRTRIGKSGGKQTPFVFTCASAEDAAALAALLPATKDAAFLADESFIEQVRALPDGGSGLRSVTNLVLVANAAVFIIMGALGAGWLEVADMRPYFEYGANNAAATTDGEWWRLVSYMFMHYGLVHLLLNAWAFFQAGHLVERLFGRGLYALIYFGSGIIGGLATLRWNGDRIWSAGASGAVFGVYGALLGYLWREQHRVPAGIFRPMLKSTLLFAGYSLFYGAVHPNIDNAAHLGGLLAGLLLGWVGALPLEPEARARLRGRRDAIGAALAAAAIAVGVIVAPRYDYRARDEFVAWPSTIRAMHEQEVKLLTRERAALTDFMKSHDAQPLAHWLKTQAVPAHEAWLKDLQPLRLAAETARERERIRRIYQARIESYRQFADELIQGRSDALENYRRRVAELRDGER